MRVGRSVKRGRATIRGRTRGGFLELAGPASRAHLSWMAGTRTGPAMAPDDQTRAELNRLYWGSDASVGDIADRLGISRRALYDGIEPRPADAPCPACGAPLVFRNRTAADRREASCEACGAETALSAEQQAASPLADDPEVERQERGAILSPVPPRAVPTAGGGAVLGGALLAGLAAGAAVGYLLRRT